MMKKREKEKNEGKRKNAGRRKKEEIRTKICERVEEGQSEKMGKGKQTNE